MSQSVYSDLLSDISDEALEAAKARVFDTMPIFTVGEAEIRGNTYKVFQNAPPHMGGLLMYGAAQHGDNEFLIFRDERYTFADIWAAACRFASALSNELGVKQGDRVAIAMRNYPEWCAAYMAIVSIGAVVTPLNAWWNQDELEAVLKDCGAKIIVVDGKRLETLKPVRDDLGLTLILARDEGDGADYLYKDLVAGVEAVAPPMPSIGPEDDCCLMYTSGSTGGPKGVLATHRSVITALMSWAFYAATLKEARNGAGPFGDNPGIVLAIPLFHVTGANSIFLLSWLVGRRVVMLYRWDPKEAVDVIRKEGLTNFVGVPSQSFELIEAAADGDMPSLIDIGSGGAKRPPEHVKLLKKAFPNAGPSTGYGLSETSALGTVISLGAYQLRPDSAGRVVPPVTQVQIFSEEGLQLPVGEAGEICIRSAANFREYINKPNETAEALTADGWFRTGDLGKLDEDGYLYIIDRLKDLIIRGGENISSLEVESCAYEYEGVGEASAFSVPDDVLGERVGLVIVPLKDAVIDVTALRAFMAEGLAYYKVPERIWVSPFPLPRLGTGKFDKRTVRKIALEQAPTLSV